MSPAVNDLEPSRGVLFLLAMIYAAIFHFVVARPPKGWDQKHWYDCLMIAVLGVPFLLIIVLIAGNLLLLLVAPTSP